MDPDFVDQVGEHHYSC